MAKKYHCYDVFCILACVYEVYNFFPPTPFPPRKEDTNKKPATQYSLQLPAKKDHKEKEITIKKEVKLYLGGGLKYFVFSPLLGEMIPIWLIFLRMGWNHRLVSPKNTTCLKVCNALTPLAP